MAHASGRGFNSPNGISQGNRQLAQLHVMGLLSFSSSANQRKVSCNFMIKRLKSSISHCWSWSSLCKGQGPPKIYTRQQGPLKEKGNHLLPRASSERNTAASINGKTKNGALVLARFFLTSVKMAFLGTYNVGTPPF